MFVGHILRHNYFGIFEAQLLSTVIYMPPPLSAKKSTIYMGCNSLDAYCVKKLVILLFALSKFCDFFLNALLKTDLSLFRQLCSQSNNIQPILDITCSLQPLGAGGQGSLLRLIQVSELIQTSQNHTQIQNNMLHPSKYFHMHPQLAARAPQGPPRAPHKSQRELKTL